MASRIFVVVALVLTICALIPVSPGFVPSPPLTWAVLCLCLALLV